MNTLLSFNLRDHLVDRIPLGEEVYVIEFVSDAPGAGRIDYGLQTSRIFTATLPDSDGSGDYEEVSSYDHPDFVRFNGNIEVDLDNGQTCSGLTFLNMRCLWCLASEVQGTLTDIDSYFGLLPVDEPDDEEDDGDLDEEASWEEPVCPGDMDEDKDHAYDDTPRRES